MARFIDPTSGMMRGPFGVVHSAVTDQDTVRANVLYAMRLMGDAKYAEAPDPLERAEAIDPGDVQVLYDLALCHSKLGHTAQMQVCRSRVSHRQSLRANQYLAR